MIHSLGMRLSVAGAAQFIEFCRAVFEARELARLSAPDGTIRNAELQFGDTRLAVTDEAPVVSNPSALTLGGTPITLQVQTADCDAVTRRAVDHGAVLLTGPLDAFWGARYAVVRDPFGNEWGISSPLREVSQEEMEAGAAAFEQRR